MGAPCAIASVTPGAKSGRRPGSSSETNAMCTCTTRPSAARHAAARSRKRATARRAPGTGSSSPKPTWRSMLTSTVVLGSTG
jgi:hypothetical protein